MANINLYRVSVPKGAYSKVAWTECDFNPAPQQYLQEGLRSIDFQAVNNSVSASSVATVSIIGYCNDDCTGCYLIGETTTTSTTIPPVNFTLTPSCEGSGVNGTGKILVNGFSGGSGVYQSIAIASTPGGAISATPIPLSGASTYSFTGLFNNTWYVVLRDSTGAFTTKSTNVNCTVTTTTTTSTTTAAPICTYAGGSAVITYTTTTTTTATPQCNYDGLTVVCDGTTTTSTSTSTTTTTTTAPGETTTSTSTTTTSAPSATLQWDFEEVGGADGTMYLYVNGSVIESRSITSSGTYAVYEGDTINVEVSCNTCFSPNNCSTAESQSNKSVLVASDTVNSSIASIFTSVYTVVSGDMGNTINLSTFAICNSTCL